MKNIVIVGAGFGGLRAAKLIGQAIKHYGLKDKYTLILIDKNNYHTYTPTLYEAATTSKQIANYSQIKDIIAFPVSEIVKDEGIVFINGNVSEIDLISGDIHSENDRIKFDYLILAMGSETNFFDITGLEENCFTLKTFVDAIKLRDKITELYAEKSELRIVLGGGGSTGVELAGEIEGWVCELKNEMTKPCGSKITIVEAAPSVLPGFPEKVISKATHRLRSLGVEIISGDPLEEAQKNTVTLKSGKNLPFDILIWTGGIKASRLMGTLPLKNEHGQVVVQSEMECLPQSTDLNLWGQIYGIGDAICFHDPITQKPIPLTARAAIIQGEVAAKNIIEDMKAKEGLVKNARVYTYTPENYPYVMPVGGKYAIAKIGPFIFSGIFAWFFKGLVELNYLWSIMGFGRALKVWLKGLKIFIKNDRLG